jgi:hypothetical protein
MKNIYLFCAGLLVHIAAFSADDISATKPFFIINNTDHYMKINLTLSGKEILKKLILTSGSSVTVNTNKEERSMEISGAILAADTLKKTKDSNFGYIHDRLESSLQGVILSSNKIRTESTAFLQLTMPLATSLVLALSGLDLDESTKILRQHSASEQCLTKQKASAHDIVTK